MSAQHKGLGKGLSALMSDKYSQTATVPSKDGGQMQLPVGKLVSGKFQPRMNFRQDQLLELAESVKKNGIMQPIIVRPADAQDGMFEIIAGERRWRAAKLAKLSAVPVIIRQISDQQALELALVENIQRQDLSPLEEATGFQRLIDEFSYTQEELAGTVGKSRSHIANLLRLLSLPDELKDMLDSDQISMGHARALLGAPNALELAREVVNRGLNVRQTESLCRTGLPSAERKSRAGGQSDRYLEPRGSNRQKDDDIIALEETLSENLGLKVSINDRGQNGEIIIAYNSLSQLDEILRRLGGG